MTGFEIHLELEAKDRSADITAGLRRCFSACCGTSSLPGADGLRKTGVRMSGRHIEVIRSLRVYN